MVRVPSAERPSRGDVQGSDLVTVCAGILETDASFSVIRDCGPQAGASLIDVRGNPRRGQQGRSLGKQLSYLPLRRITISFRVLSTTRSGSRASRFASDPGSVAANAPS